MRDGVRIAIDVLLPDPMPAGAQIPAILIQSRYWRALALRAPLKWLIRPEDLNSDYRDFERFFTGQGYALVKVDVRGTGASFGCWEYPWHADTIQDGYEIVEWIVSQPWSNGSIAGLGISYLGTTAELLAACCHPAVKASAALFSHPDAYTDIAFPGGLFNERFVRAWGEMDEVLDRNQIPRQQNFLARYLVAGVRPVRGQEALLAEAVREHCVNGSIYRIARLLTFRDEHMAEMGSSLEQMLVEKHLKMIRLSGAALCGFGSWMDAGTADAVLRRFLTLETASLAVIGAWDHGGQRNASPYRRPSRPGNPPLMFHWAEILSFFDACLKPGSAAATQGAEKTLHYYTMGEEKWKTTSVWPPRGMARQSLFLTAGRTLSWEPPVTEGKDEYVVDFQASTGRTNRWWAMGPSENRSVSYHSRLRAARRMLVYHSPPLERDLEISGYPVIRLFMASSETDGALIVYLEDVDERDRVRYVTEGELRLLHRKVSAAPGPYRLQVPYHTFKAEDALPLVPGEVVELNFGLLPTSVLIRRGHRLRLGIAGHDQGTFARLPAVGQPHLTFYFGPDYPSSIEIPAAYRAL